MILRHPLVLGLVIGFVSVFSFSAPASALEGRETPARQSAAPENSGHSLPVGKVARLWPALDQGQKAMVDLLAADFFQNSLSAQQRSRIFAQRADEYRAASADERDSLRQQRRREWQAEQSLSQSASVSATGTSYDLLSDVQKAPFRRHAMDQLDLGETGPQTGLAGRDNI